MERIYSPTPPDSLPEEGAVTTPVIFDHEMEYKKVMSELSNLRESVRRKKEMAGKHKHDYDQVMKDMLRQRDEATAVQVKQQREAQLRQDALLDKWGAEQADFRKELRLEREEARRERLEAQARQDVFVTRLFEQNQLLNDLVFRRSGEFSQLRDRGGRGIGETLPSEFNHETTHLLPVCA